MKLNFIAILQNKSTEEQFIFKEDYKGNNLFGREKGDG